MEGAELRIVFVDGGDSAAPAPAPEQSQTPPPVGSSEGPQLPPPGPPATQSPPASPPAQPAPAPQQQPTPLPPGPPATYQPPAGPSAEPLTEAQAKELFDKFGVTAEKLGLVVAGAATKLESASGAASASADPLLAPGHVRLYNGGSADPTTLDSSAWLTPYKDYAQGYANKAADPLIRYVDVPEGHPELVKSFDDSDTPGAKAPYTSFQASESLSKRLRPLSSQGPTAQPEASPPQAPGATAQPAPGAAPAPTQEPTEPVPGAAPAETPPSPVAPPTATPKPPKAPKATQPPKVQAKPPGAGAIATKALTSAGKSAVSGLASSAGGAIGGGAGAAAAGEVAAGAMAALGPALIPVGAAAGAFAIAVGAAAVGTKVFVDALSAGAESIKEYSPDVAGANAENEVRQIFAMLRRADAVGPQLADFQRDMGKANEAATEVMTEILKVMVDIWSEISPAVQEGITEVRKGAALIPVMQQWINSTLIVMGDWSKSDREKRNIQAAIMVAAERIARLLRGDDDTGDWDAMSFINDLSALATANGAGPGGLPAPGGPGRWTRPNAAGARPRVWSRRRQL